MRFPTPIFLLKDSTWTKYEQAKLDRKLFRFCKDIRLQSSKFVRPSSQLLYVLTQNFSFW